MSLLDDLRSVASKISPSDIPTPAETAQIIGALIGYVEHPDTFLTEVKQDAENLVNPPVTPAPAVVKPASDSVQSASPPAPATTTDATTDSRLQNLETGLATISQQIQNLVANLQATQVTVSTEDDKS